MVARDTEGKGAFEDAVRLYDLAKVIFLSFRLLTYDALLTYKILMLHF